MSSSLELPAPSGASRTRDHIFISYDHADRALVERLAGDLRSHGYTTWIDFEGIRGGDVWRQAIVDGIYASAVVLIAISPDAVRSEWVGTELQAALDFKKRIVPLLVRPLDTDEDRTAYQRLHIDHIQYRDFTGGYASAFEKLLRDLPPPQVGVPGHCNRVAAELATRAWGLDHYIQSEARLLPIDASPYEDGIVTGKPESLLHRLHQSHRLIVLGEPGTGKTVALERLAWELATGNPPVVPVLIKLVEYDGKPLLKWVYLNLRSYGEIKHQGVDETRAFLMDERQPFCCYFLLDGLNEVRPQHRDTILAEIRQLALEFPRHHLAVTSRVQDECWGQLRQGTALQETFLVQPIHLEQAQRYLEAHLDAADGHRLWTQLDERMRELATTPLLLWLIKEAWVAARQQSEGTIRMPDNRGALYQSFVNRLLKRDDERRLTEQIPEAVRVVALERLARAMHEEKSLAVDRAAALALVENQTILEALLVNGLLVPVGERLRFAPHQTLQEHFAARAFKDDIMTKATARGVARLVRRFNPGVLEYADDVWWAETFIQLAGLVDDPNALASALADINPWLALWCVHEGRQVTDTTRDIIRARSEALVRSSRVQDRRRAAEALVRLQTPRVIEPLIHLAADADEPTGRIAISYLKNVGDIVAKPLADTLNDLAVVPPARLRIGQALSALGDPRLGVGLRADGLPDIDWAEIPAGEFTFGDESESSGPVTLTLPTFCIARYPITYAQFQAFLEAPDGFERDEWWEDLTPEYRKQVMGEQAFKFSNHPRESVSWYQAVTFCKWLTAKLGFEVRLPTEQEWEKAARGTDGREYPWGQTYISGYADIDERYEHAGKHHLETTTAVGMYPQGASPYGALDMSGNVFEWCLNTPDGDISLGGEAARVLRGGAWNGYNLFARCAFRLRNNPSLRNNYAGFRVVCARPMP